ncbi:MAG: histidine phosphatase family protein [Oscillospiraceae bacterium]|nr:histidine phosphatase family protein [Oscillospiraceae bacterium]
MKIVFVRHGHPDYVNDCLTDLGHKQAESAALRLKDEGIEEIYSSPFGRAFETAQHTAKIISKEVVKLDFMREIRWGATEGNEVYADGHPWDTSLYAVSLGHSLMDESWTKDEPFCNNVVFSELERVAREADEWLLTMGYKREGANYRVVGENTNKTIAVFSHGGSSSALFSHLLNLPFFYLCRALCPDFTSITVLNFGDEVGSLTAPQIEYANDSKHIKSKGVSYEM